MAGATVAVLLRRHISEIERGEIRRYIESVASSIDDHSFWVAGQPFVWAEGTPAEDQYETGILGWTPVGSIEFGAMCRGSASDAYLAMLAAHVAQMFDTVIALSGHIDTVVDDVMLVMEGLYKGEYEDYVTPEFLHRWINHPNFRMIN